jgi:hypothetical protein
MSRGWLAAALAAALLALAAGAEAQGNGRVSGAVLDASTGRALPGAQVAVQGSALRAGAGVDGRYTLDGVPAGTHALVVTHLGYAAKTVTGVQVGAGSAAAVDVTLAPATLLLGEITVTARAERGSVGRALDEQRTAVGVVSSVSAEQIARSPDSDAAQAVQRVSGVTLQDGRYVSVRGLGERYTTTSLNGARIPSPDPERKMVPLDLFPAGMLQAVTTSKTFTPDQPGDFSGAQVNLRTREYPAGRTFALSLSAGANDAVTGAAVPLAPTVGREWLGMAGAEREVPALVRQAGSLSGNLSRADRNRLIGSFRNAWSAREGTAGPSLSGALTLGGTEDLAGREVGYLVSGSYAHGYEARQDEVRTRAYADGSGEAAEAARFTGSTGRTSVLWGGLANLSVRLGEGTRISFDNLLNRTADNEARRETGSDENLGASVLHIDRLRFVERTVRSHQLRGDHALGARHGIRWSMSASAVDRDEPDRSEIVYSSEIDPGTGTMLPRAWFGASNEAAVRTFASLGETVYEGTGSYAFSFPGGAGHRLEVGGLVRRTSRDADNVAYSLFSQRLPRAEREAAPEEIFDGRYLEGDADLFGIAPMGQGGSYQVEDRLAAGYAMAEIGLGRRARLVGGARLERSQVRVDAQPTTGQAVQSTPEYLDVLPSLALNLALSDRQNLRLSASQTLSRPEYREIAPVQYREVIGAENLIGNPNLRRSLIRNLDLRWELYPAAGEVLSVAVFAKRFHDPIERVYLAQSGTALVTFENARGAENYGVELEARKTFGFLAQRLDALTGFANLTLMQSDIQLDPAVGSQRNTERPMVGQAPYVVNAGLTYAPGSGAASATLLYNVTGRRIHSAAEAPLPEVYEMPRRLLDLAFRFPLRGGLAGKLDARNLLDASHELRQGEVVRESYRTGRSFSLGVSVRR